MRLIIIILSIIIISACSSTDLPDKTHTSIKDINSNEVISKDIKAYVSKNLAGWSLPDTSDYIKSWWSFYDKSVIPYAVKTDINDDGIADYGLILKNDSTFRFVILMGNKDSFTHWVSDDFKKSFNSVEKKIQFGLTVQPPGRIDIAIPEIKSLILKSNAINLMEFEMRDCIFYWDNGKIKVFNTKNK